MRSETLLNEGWLFHRGDIVLSRPAWKGPAYAQSKTERKKAGPAAWHYNDQPDQYGSDSGLLTHERWERVQLPHDYVVDQDLNQFENNAHGYLHYDNAWYRKHFALPESARGKRVLVRFDGVAGCATVYLNGCLMRRNHSSYNTFEIDVSDYVSFDSENVLAVYVNTQEFEGWWYQGGGIYRDVHLTVTEPVAIDLWGVYAPYRKIAPDAWQIDFETTLVNAGDAPRCVTVMHRVLDGNGVCVATAQAQGQIMDREKGVICAGAIVHDPHMWDCENPYLYTVHTTLTADGQELDADDTRIGFRTVEISADKGLLLNGKRQIIRGVCAHQDFGLTGLAVPANIARYKVALMKEMGANGFRTSHYQHTAAYMDAFDEMGFLVMDEARWFENTPEAMEQLASVVKRDRNRPSVIFWSTSNEEPFHVTDVGRRLHKSISAQIRKLDHTRCILAAQSERPEQSTIYDDCDVIGINYNLSLYDDVHRMYPDKAIVASECCATGTSRDWNYPSDSNGRLRDKDADTSDWFLGREKTWKALMQRPYVIGGYQWAATEHRGEATWPAACSKSGALDLFLFKKGAFYQNQSHWTNQPMAHIVPHWNFAGLEGQRIPVTVYTNCDELELLLNGKSLGRQTIERYGHGEWNVNYAPGELTVRGYRDGRLVCEDTRVTTGRPARLRLTLDNDFRANGTDLALFTCECTDAQGRIVPDAAEFVSFSVAAPAELIATGSDNCDHNRVGLAERKMYMGKIRIAVRPAKGQTQLSILAHSDVVDDCLLEIDIAQGK